MAQPKIAARGLLVAGILFLIASVIPLARGGTVSVAFLIVAGVFVVVATIIGNRGRTTKSQPPHE